MALFEWFKTVRSQNVPIDGPMLTRKANSLACELGMENFQATNGFIERFKNRHGISSKTLSGEGASVDNSQTENWMQSKLPNKHIDKQINILKAIQWFYAAWKDVTPTCIQNCFRKAGFMNQAQHEINATPQGHVSDSSDTDEFEDNDIPLAELASKWNRLRVFSDIDKNISFDDYINADENVVSVEQKSDSDIKAEV
ncbi:uncharacterized protein LOC132755964 [Ruditapes philippinarum]|uniref:uncharacterized protein LOC132755964 n=1 Tax=Ruditapes philippinarum TaxID=129788 RepID=UPI00295BB771|nr:uncharacterized protein LOC132755964 [Ruditapes philippinarum]